MPMILGLPRNLLSLSLDLSAALDTIDQTLLLNRLTSSFRHSLNYQHHLSSKFTSLASNSETLDHFLLHNTIPSSSSSSSSSRLIVHLKNWPVDIFTTSLRSIASASLCRLHSPLPINITLASCGLRHAGPSIWNSLPRHLRSTDSYNVFKSNLKTHKFSCASISSPLQHLQALMIQHNHIDFCVMKLYYVMSCVSIYVLQQCWRMRMQIST